ncbi:MAG: ATP-dependent DNA helicase RecG [Patescibacteria group bacterium]|nr:ATP-dependent DNA helicase RecG [Patescibacteria group bacterium]
MSQKLKKLGVITIQDLIFYYPRVWLDFGQTTPISQLRLNDQAIICAKVLEIANIRTFKKKMLITRAKLADSSGEITATWFSQPYLTKNILVGSQWLFMGKVAFDWQKREKILANPIYEENAQILPIYPETKGVTSKYLRRIIRPLLEKITVNDYLPDNLLEQEKLLSLPEALKNIHFPKNQKLLAMAKLRLAFDELLLIALRMQILRENMQKQSALNIKINKEILLKFTRSLKFNLTNAQRKAAWEIINDLSKKTPMNRLLEGDVGSGKTVVALLAALNAIKSGYQVAWMAPTSILAEQHFQTASKLLKHFDIKITLLTAKNHKKSLAHIKNSQLIIGTHALIQKGVRFSNLALVIIDEQHRFGVKQRMALVHQLPQTNKPINTNNIGGNLSNNSRSLVFTPHFLSMTATPIPRTLALSLYADLDISILDEMPKDRKKIITRLVDSINRQKAYEFIGQQIKTGRQVFVICPLIEDKSSQLTVNSNQLFNMEKKSVEKEFERLSQEIFPKYKVAKLYGKMKEEEKAKIMANFMAKKIDILVSTSVVEVGVDVPNATVMVIEDAERFGLAQLHQFRGRVGRGTHQSFCLLFTNVLSEETNRRLKALVECNDGFKLAQKDLEIRGPGELVGIEQSGQLDLKMAKLSDIILIEKARNWAKKIVGDGVDKYPKLKIKLKEFEKLSHLE